MTKAKYTYLYNGKEVRNSNKVYKYALINTNNKAAETIAAAFGREDMFDGEDATQAKNEFIRNLVSDINKNGTIIYKLNLDMQQIASTPYNSKKYQE